MSERDKPSTSVEGEVAASQEGLDPVALAAFLSSLAHDLRTPLGVVSEALTELRTDLASALTDEHRLLVTLADRGLRRLGRIADTVSLVAALDSGHFELSRRSVDLVELMRAATVAATAIEPRREVELVCELPGGPARGMADEERLSHAISEIVINAIRHARRQVRVTLQLAAGEARLAVEDDGQGVAEQARGTLFRRFASSRSRSGLGMGLSTAHDVIVAHGGGLTLEASTLSTGRPNTIGARFVISLPISGGA